MTAPPRLFRRMRNLAARPCEVPFLFATFSLGTQRKSRRKIFNRSEEPNSTILNIDLQKGGLTVGLSSNCD